MSRLFESIDTKYVFQLQRFGRTENLERNSEKEVENGQSVPFKHPGQERTVAAYQL